MCIYLLDFYDFLDDFFYCNDFGNLSDDFNDSFNDVWHFNHSFHNLFDSHNFFDLIGNDHRDFKRDIDDPFNLLNLFYFNNLFDYLLNGNNGRNFNDSVYDLLDDLFNLNDLRDNSEYLKDIVNIYYSHNLLIDHTDDTLVNFQNCATSNS